MVYTAVIQDLESKLFGLHPKAKELYSLIAGLKDLSFDDIKQSDFLDSSTKFYNKNSGVDKKILFALSYLNKPSKIGDIECIIKKFEPDFKKQFYNALKVLKENKEIGLYNPTGSKRSAYYGLRSWFNDDSSLKDEFAKNKELKRAS